MAGFLSTKAQVNTKGRQEYVIAEDRIIVDGLEEDKSAAEIADLLQAAGFNRTAVSVRYRTALLRNISEKYETLEAFHASKHVQPVLTENTASTKGEPEEVSAEGPVEVDVVDAVDT